MDKECKGYKPDSDDDYKEKNFKVECVIVCVNYSDFLAHTLPHNKQYFDKIVVVTDLHDLRTKKLCDFYNVHCIQTDVFYEGTDKFNKGKGINAGLEVLDKDGWVVHLDADIWLPSLTRQLLSNACLREDHIYGIDRMMCPSYNEWIDFLEDPQLTHTAWVYVYPTIFELGVRVAEYKTEGYVPIGFFQMWNPKGSKVYKYPSKHDGASRTDTQFAKLFTRRNRGFIPELVGIHLESEKQEEMGINWEGRKTPIFRAKTEREKHGVKVTKSREE